MELYTKTKSGVICCGMNRRAVWSSLTWRTWNGLSGLGLSKQHLAIHRVVSFRDGKVNKGAYLIELLSAHHEEATAAYHCPGPINCKLLYANTVLCCLGELDAGRGHITGRRTSKNNRNDASHYTRVAMSRSLSFKTIASCVKASLNYSQVKYRTFLLRLTRGLLFKYIFCQVAIQYTVSY